jgi:type IV pilus assembly protein PilA
MVSPTKSSSAFVRPGSESSGFASGGFSLIEAMVVIAIVAIMATLAVPGYLEKLIRDQVVEALPLADVAKAPIAKAWAASQPLPEDNAAAELPAPDKIVNYVVTSVTVHGGAIDITFGNKANGNLKGKILTLRPAVVDDAPVVPITWVCGYAAAPPKMSVKGPNSTTVPSRYLPLKCRTG